jgi:hypothetical protein
MLSASDPRTRADHSHPRRRRRDLKGEVETLVSLALAPDLAGLL